MNAGSRAYGTVSSDVAPGRAGDVYICEYVADPSIPAHHRKRARRYIDRAARDLGIGGIRLRWFRVVEVASPPGQARVDGLVMVGPGEYFWGQAEADGQMPLGVVRDADPDAIALNASLRGPALMAVCGHEVRHIAQNRALGPADARSIDDREMDAERYGVDFAARQAERVA